MINKISDEFILSIEIEDNIFDGSKVVGSFYKNTGSLEVFDYDGQYSDLVGEEITITRISEKSTWYINSATFNEADDTINFELYDLSYKLDEIYENLFVSGMTIYEWLKAICDKFGIVLGVASFPNSNYELANSPFVDENLTYRNVIQMIAEAGGCFAKFENDELIIRYFSTTEIVTLADWIELTIEDSSSPINVVVLGNDLEDNIMYPSEIPTNPVELSIDNNQILYLDRETMIIPIYNNLVGSYVTPFSIQFEEGMQIGVVKSGVILNTINKDLKIITVKTMNISISYNGTWTYTIESEIPTETETEYEYAGTVTKIANETKATVDKLNGEIELLVSDVDTLENDFILNSDDVSSELYEISSKFNNYVPTNEFVSYREEMTLTLNNQSATFASKNELVDGSVTMVQTTTVLIDYEGVLVNTDDATAKTLLSTNGFTVTDKTGYSESELSYMGYDEILKESVVRVANIDVTKYANLGQYSRWKDYKDPKNNKGTGLFLI